MKNLLYLIVVIVAICLINFWYQFYVVGHYYNSAGLFFTLLLGSAPIVIVYLSYLLIKTIKNEKSI